MRTRPARALAVRLAVPVAASLMLVAACGADTPVPASPIPPGATLPAVVASPESGSANAAEHRLLQSTGSGSANAAEYRLAQSSGSGSANAAEYRLTHHAEADAGS